MAKGKKKAESLTEEEIRDNSVPEGVSEEPQTELPAKQPKKHGPIDYVERAIQLLEAEKPCENYHTALKMLMGAKIFIQKEVG